MPSSLISQQIDDIGDIYMLYIGIFNLVVGIIGNVSMILVFTSLRIFKGNQSAFYLSIEYVSNIGLLLAIYLPRILIYILGYDPVLTSLSWCKIRTMISKACGLCSLVTICFLAFDQYLSTNHRYSWRQMSTLKLAYRFTFFNVCFAILHSISFLILSDIQPSMECAMYNLVAKHYYSLFYYPVLSGALPLIISISFSLLAYRNVRRIVRRHTCMSILRRRLDLQMTSMTLSCVICIVICSIPFIGISVYELNVNNSDDNYMQLAIVSLISSILYSLLYTNFAVN